MSNQFEKDSHQKSAAALDDKATQWGGRWKKSETKLFVAGTGGTVLNTATDSKCQVSQNVKCRKNFQIMSVGS